jgi:hypothetical protein
MRGVHKENRRPRVIDRMIEVVFTVHTARPDDAGTVEVVYGSEREARAFAESRSRDLSVVSASVTRFLVGQFGTRHPIALYVAGAEQPQWFNHPHLYPSAAVDDNGGRPTVSRRARVP